jgi:hypothetical protein
VNRSNKTIKSPNDGKNGRKTKDQGRELEEEQGQPLLGLLSLAMGLPVSALTHLVLSHPRGRSCHHLHFSDNETEAY